MLVRDQLNRAVEFVKYPIRIVSLVPSQTELLVDLGLRSSLVGITKFCIHPKGLNEKAAIVGGTKKVHFDKIGALRPDIIICNKEENTKEIVEACEKIAPTWVSDIYSVKDCLKMIESLGTIFNVVGKATEIKRAIVSEMQDFSKFIKGKRVKRVAYLIWKNPYMAAGSSTFINDLLVLNNYDNILSEATRYPEIDAATLKDVDLILLSSEPYPFKNSDVLELKKALQKEVLLVDGEYFSWYGSRLQNAFAYFKTLH